MLPIHVEHILRMWQTNVFFFIITWQHPISYRICIDYQPAEGARRVPLLNIILIANSFWSRIKKVTNSFSNRIIYFAGENKNFMNVI